MNTFSAGLQKLASVSNGWTVIGLLSRAKSNLSICHRLYELGLSNPERMSDIQKPAILMFLKLTPFVFCFLNFLKKTKKQK